MTGYKPGRRLRAKAHGTHRALRPAPTSCIIPDTLPHSLLVSGGDKGRGRNIKDKRENKSGGIYQSMEMVWAVGCGFTYLGRVMVSTPLL